MTETPMQPTDRQLDFLWEEISTGNSVLFVGAGVSAGRFPRWRRLIDRLRDEFDIADQSGDALDVPQWVVEAAPPGERSPPTNPRPCYRPPSGGQTPTPTPPRRR